MLTFQQTNENSADSAAMLKVIQHCTHCGEETNKGNKFCKNCTTAAARKEMCDENKIIVPSYFCGSVH